MISLFWVALFPITWATDVFNGFDFNGKKLWSQEMLDLCESERFVTHTYKENICVRYVVDFTYQNVEILSYYPILIQFHNFYTEKDALALIDDTEKEKLAQLRVSDGVSSKVSPSRNANGTWIGHTKTNQSRKMFEIAERKMPNIDLKAAEDWQVLSYHPGGHYAPHCDYIYYKSPLNYDWWMINKGHRVATFLTVLKTADAGGGTVFPTIGVTMTPKVGDVIFWFNQNVDYTQCDRSLHGACPIREGQKIAATLWIHTYGNELNYKAFDKTHFDINAFVNPQYFNRAKGEESSSVVDYDGSSTLNRFQYVPTAPFMWNSNGKVLRDFTIISHRVLFLIVLAISNICANICFYCCSTRYGFPFKM